MDVRWGEQKEVDRKRRKTIDDIMVAGGRELIDTCFYFNIACIISTSPPLSFTFQYVITINPYYKGK